MQRLFLIGSGFTHAATGGEAPLNRMRLQRLVECDPRLWAELSTRYNCCLPSATRSDDLETLLTLLDLEPGENDDSSHLRDLRVQVNRSLAAYFRKFRFSEERVRRNGWLRDFVRATFTSGDVIISLNYDCLLEGLLDYYDQWTPRGGYGSLSAAHDAVETWQVSPTSVLKIHGSENFRSQERMGSKGELFIDFTVNDSIFPHSGKNKNYNLPRVDTEDAIIAPSFVKSYPWQLLDLMRDAIITAREARTLAIIGCGIRREDSWLYQLLWHFLRGEGKKRIIILDPMAEDIKSRISRALEFDFAHMRPVDAIREKLETGWPKLLDEPREPVD